MKYKDIPLLTLATILIALSTYHIIERNDILMGVGIGVFAIYTITYVIICIKREKRLEGELLSNEERRKRLFSKIFKLETDLANQVKATDEVEKERDTYKKLVSKGSVIYINGTECVIGDYDKETKVLQIDIVNYTDNPLTKEQIELQKEYIENATKIIPFATDNDNTTEQYICPKCKKPMKRHTERIAFCDNIECDRKRWRIDKLDKAQ